jgi:hypothetical protein
MRNVRQVNAQDTPTIQRHWRRVRSTWFQRSSPRVGSIYTSSEATPGRTAIRRNALREQTIAEAKQHGSLLHDRSVNVSLRPGHYPNWKAACSWSEVPVVVYGDAELDVEAIDPTSIRLGRALAESVSLSDVNGDGFADLVATFVVSKTGLRPNSRGSMFVARMKSSQLLFGNDQVVLLPAENKP